MIIERNYRKNPYTANFLMTFHTAGGTNLGGAVAEVAKEEDLLDSIPVRMGYTPSDRQRQFIDDLTREIKELDIEAGHAAHNYTLGMTQHGRWTREKVSTWIERLIAKRDALRAAATKPAAPQVADGRYAVEEDGILKFFRVKNGRRPGFVFLDTQASDDWFPIRIPARRAAILATIAQNPQAAMIRYGQEIGRCGRCGRTLTNENSRAAGIGPECASK